MGKISRLNINGKVVDIDDKDAVQLPDEYNNGDTLVYDEQNQTFVAKSTNDAIGLQNELNNQQKPVSSKTVNAAFSNINSIIRGGLYNRHDEITLEYDYKADTHEVRARAFNDKYDEASFDLGDKLDIAIFCLDADYDASSETYYIGSFLGILTIDNTKIHIGDEWDVQSVDMRSHYSGTLVIPESVKTRVLNFVILNTITSSGIIRKSLYNSIIVPSNNANTITVSSSDVGLYESQLIFTLNQAIPASSSIDLKISICGGRDYKYVEIKKLTLTAGQSSFTLNIGESGYNRKVCVEIVDSHDNDYTLINANSIVSGRIPVKLLVFTFMPKHWLSQVLQNRNIDIISGSTKYSELNPATDSAISLDTDNKLEIGYSYQGSSSSGTDSLPMDGNGYTVQELAEEFDIQESDIPLLGRNIHYNTNFANSIQLSGIINLAEDEGESPYNDTVKYIILNHQQFELWVKDENGYLISSYIAPVDFYKNN